MQNQSLIEFLNLNRNRFVSRLAKRYDLDKIEDAIQNVYMTFLEKNIYSVNKSKFYSFIETCIKNEIKMGFNSIKKLSFVSPLKEDNQVSYLDTAPALDVLESITLENEYKLQSDQIYKTLPTLSSVQKKCIKYFLDHGKRMEYSTVSARAFRVAITKIREDFNGKPRIVKKNELNKLTPEQVLEIRTNVIQDHNGRFVGSGVYAKKFGVSDSAINKILTKTNLWKNVVPVEKSKVPMVRTHCKRGHEVTPDNIILWGKTKRCKTCVVNKKKKDSEVQSQKRKEIRIAKLKAELEALGV